MDFLDPKLEDYIEMHSSEEPELLKELNRETYAKVLVPRMLSGHLQGRVLSMLSKMINPKYILEIGTYTGYSALSLAEGLQKDGRLITIDINEELEEIVKRYFDKAGVSGLIDFRIGNALEIIPSIDHNLDMVFIDADKDNYCNYFDLVIDKLVSGGIIIADNVLWSGKIIEPIDDQDSDTKGLVAFNKKVQEDTRVENVLLPVRDGLMVIRKI